jgi:hypothetical protein
MVETLSQYQATPARFVGPDRVEWRSPTTGAVVGTAPIAPSGRKGLWEAMQAARRQRSLALLAERTRYAPSVRPTPSIERDTDPAPTPESAAHQYLARLVVAERNEQADDGLADGLAEVIDLAAYRQARRKSA